MALTKRYGDKTAVDDLTFTVRPGVVTGFLGPNGAGKSTTMRMILGLDAPTSGTVDGQRQALRRARRAAARGRRAAGGQGRPHRPVRLQPPAGAGADHGIPRRRVDEVIDLVGLREVARKRAGGFSLGMGQRLGVAAALLGDPATLILDEPVNGLDPEGILWIRNLLQRLAAEGRTVFVSSHLMSEMALTAEHLIVIGRGRLIADTSVAEFIRSASTQGGPGAHPAGRHGCASCWSARTSPSTEHRTRRAGGRRPDQRAQIGRVACDAGDRRSTS